MNIEEKRAKLRELREEVAKLESEIRAEESLPYISFSQIGNLGYYVNDNYDHFDIRDSPLYYGHNNKLLKALIYPKEIKVEPSISKDIKITPFIEPIKISREDFNNFKSVPIDPKFTGIDYGMGYSVSNDYYMELDFEVKDKSNEGNVCKRCGMYNEYAESDIDYTCYNCRS